MDEEVTYADLRFHVSSHVSPSCTLEKNTEVASSEHNNRRCRCQKKTYIIIGILVGFLLLALIAVTILLLQASEKQNYYRGRIQSILHTLENVKNDLCINNEGEQKDSCLICPMNWVLIQKKCYYMPDHMLSWQESQRFCLSQNSSLFMPKTLEERDFIICNFRRWIQSQLWIGLTCSLQSNGKWLWLDNTTYNVYSSQCRELRCASFDYSVYLYPSCGTQLNLICQRLPVNLPDIS
ncbi:C-type lectin domain family 4 member A-like isoform X2 [Hyla sarda]|uniref:C-type lectin domain family 4 member A-like isoform X2 n=1 Tax=Hyla sarda TaxID=327740 RepID=UPI0024C4166B|nr:C-type lectin domain family 4 member A-like isoform X2 [Hyla sarda]